MILQKTESSIKPNFPATSPQIILKLQHWYDQNNNSMINSYTMLQLLGAGSYAKVYKAKRNDELFALKMYSLRQLQNTRYSGQKEYQSNVQLLQLQMKITKIINHKNIVRCYQILQNKEQIITVNELGDLGDLMNWSEMTQSFSRNQIILKYIYGKYKVKTLLNAMQILFKQVSQAVAYLHSNKITHRDIKPANIISKKTQQLHNQIKVIDFNTSRMYEISDVSYYPAGTPGFRSPQHQFGLAQGYSSKAADIWSLGITMFVYYHEKLPFKGESVLQMDIEAKNSQIQFSQQCPQFLRNIIKKMTQKKWNQRISIDQVLDLMQKWDKY